MSSSETGSQRTKQPAGIPCSPDHLQHLESPSSMTSVVHSAPSALPRIAEFGVHERPRLPPILSIDEFHRGLTRPPALSSPVNRSLYHNIPIATPLGQHHPPTAHDHSHEVSRLEGGLASRAPSWTLEPHHAILENPLNPLKRNFGHVSAWPERTASISHPGAPVMHTEAGMSPYQIPQTNPSISNRSSVSDYLTPARTDSIAATTNTDYSTSQVRRSSTNRYSLHIRQQPRAARAGPDGKDRRAIDPPPVLQLLLNDFDPDSQEDMNELRSSYYVVHCRLISAQWPARDLSTLSSTNDDGSIEVQRLLLGTSVASPFHCADDPDRPSMPRHPQTKESAKHASPPPSPTSRFIVPRRSNTKPASVRKNHDPDNLPGTFFIFADLSIRRAGEYRLEFCLMRIELSTMVAGAKLPILHTVTSQVFRVVNAKDFDQVQPSTVLVKGLLDRGAGFPLKLKKGTREGGRRKGVAGSEGGGEDEDDDDDDDNEDNDDDNDNE